MHSIVRQAVDIFFQSIELYHSINSIYPQNQNPYHSGLQHILFEKNWIDTIQWHVEDEIRFPHIDPNDALQLKRYIDQLNQKRTDIVEEIDDYFMNFFQNYSIPADIPLNTESPAWAIDRLSILCLKIYHMEIEVKRVDLPTEKLKFCQSRLVLLKEQLFDLQESISDLFLDFEKGNKRMKVYRQVKMYNDPSLNPVLYQKKKDEQG